MKKVAFFVALLSLWLQAGHVHWMGDYDSALDMARREQKALLVLLVKPNCELCNHIIRDVFMNQPYIGDINSKFISVMVTYEGRASYPVEMYYSTEFPTLFFVDSASEHFLSQPLYGADVTEEHIKGIIVKNR